jgi:uncharacterized protein (DUF433 family)
MNLTAYGDSKVTQVGQLNAEQVQIIVADIRPFIERSQQIIKGISMKVVGLITFIHAYGWSPEELHFQYPHLRMSQIYSPLAYYWEHKEEIDADM